MLGESFRRTGRIRVILEVYLTQWYNRLLATTRARDIFSKFAFC